MSRVGKCLDNTPIERFFGYFKAECYDLKTDKTFVDLENDSDAYSYFDNHERMQNLNKGLIPLDMRNKTLA